MLHCFVLLSSVRDGDFHLGDRAGQYISLHYPSKQHSKQAALPSVCMHTCGYHPGITPSPQPLWLGTPVKAAGNTLVLRKLLQIQYQDLRVLCLGYKVNVDTANHHL